MPSPLLRLCCVLMFLIGSDAAVAQSSGAGAILNLLKSGRIPEARLPQVIKLVTSRGNADDLAYIYEQTTAPEGYSGEVRTTALEGLLEASQSRNVIPEGDVSQIAKLIDSESATDRKLAIQLSGEWKVSAATPALQKLITDEKSEAALKASAIEALTSIGGEAAQKTIAGLTGAEQPLNIRFLGVAALAENDLTQAAKVAADVVHDSTAKDDPSLWLTPFLERQGGADTLAASLQKNSPTEDVARVALRYMYSIGRTDPALEKTLSKIAGIEANPKPLTKEEVLALAERVRTEGDAVRGEVVFRRDDLSCMRCHAVSKAGGQVGPDLSAVGATSPIDYLINSVLEPNQAVKEAYLTKIVVTINGKSFQGIVHDRDDNRVVLKEATGKEIVIPTDDIDIEEEGSSLMPKGLTKFLTDDEFIDLIKFLSELGRVNTPYAIRSKETLQRYRLLLDPAKDLVDTVPDDGAFLSQVYEAPASDWEAVYGTVAGTLPLAPLTRKTGDSVIYVRGEVEVTKGGAVGIQVSDLTGITMWIHDDRIDASSPFVTELREGRHPVTFRIDTEKRSAESLSVTFIRPEGSRAEFTAVGGQ